MIFQLSSLAILLLLYINFAKEGGVKIVGNNSLVKSNILIVYLVEDSLGIYIYKKS